MLEYIIVLTAIVVAVAFGAKQYLAKGVEKSMENAQDAIEHSTDKLTE
jgi:hypothetical protein